MLDRLCAPLCDDLLERTGSGAVLEELATLNVMVFPLDRHGDWYRFHPMLRDAWPMSSRARSLDSHDPPPPGEHLVGASR